MARAVRILVYEGDAVWIRDTLNSSIKGTLHCDHAGMRRISEVALYVDIEESVVQRSERESGNEGRGAERRRRRLDKPCVTAVPNEEPWA